MPTMIHSLAASFTNTVTNFTGTNAVELAEPGKGKKPIAGLRQQQNQAHTFQGLECSNPTVQNVADKKPTLQLDLDWDVLSDDCDETPVTATTTMSDKNSSPVLCDSRRISEYPSPWPTFNTKLDSPTLSHGKFEAKIGGIINDLFLSADVNDTVLAVIALGCGSQHDILVQQVIQVSLGRGETTFPLVTNFVAMLSKENELTETQLLRTLHSLTSSMSDLELDVPRVELYLCELIRGFIDKGLLGEHVFSQFPEQILRAGAVEPHLSNLRLFKKKVKPLLGTFFHTADFEVLASGIRRLNMPQCNHEFMKQACFMAFDRNNRERILLLRLFSESYQSSLLTSGDLQLGYTAVIGCLDDASKDFPDMVNSVIEILTHAVVKEQVSADLVHRQHRLGFGGSLGRGVFEAVLRRTPAHSRKVWGHGDENQLVDEMKVTISEFFDSHDFDEVNNILGELHLTETQERNFLRLLITEAMIRRESTGTITLVKNLLNVYWSRKDVAAVMETIRVNSNDLVLDIPNVRQFTSHLIIEFVAIGVLDASFLYLDKLHEV